MMIRILCAVLILFVLNGCGSDSDSGSGSVMTSTPDEDAWLSEYVQNFPVLQEIYNNINTQRIDFVGIGDSNQARGGGGWDHGFQKALLNYREMYATGLLSLNAVQETGQGLGYGYFRGGTMGDNSGAPDELSSYMSSAYSDLAPHNYGYVSEGESYSADALVTLQSSLDVLGLTEEITFKIEHGLFPSGGGTFQPVVRLGNSPFTTLVTGSEVDCSGDDYSMTTSEIVLPAGTLDSPADIQLRINAPYATVGNAFFTYVHAVREDMAVGFAYSSLYSISGSSARDCAETFQNVDYTTDNSLRHFFETIRKRQGEHDSVVISIQFGMNDQNETETSVGPGEYTDGSSKEAYKDNMYALMTRIEDFWEYMGWDRSELYFLLFPSHTTSEDGDDDLIGYREAAFELCSSFTNCCALNLRKLVPYDVTSTYYAEGVDTYHLSEEGYEYFSEEIFDFIAMYSNLYQLVASTDDEIE
jgi:hypothetical protein